MIAHIKTTPRAPKMNKRPTRSVKPVQRSFLKRSSSSTARAGLDIDFVTQQSEIIGRGFTLFVFFTSTLNYLYYKDLRESQEKEEDSRDKPNKRQ